MKPPRFSLSRRSAERVVGYACQPHPYGIHLHRYRWVAWCCLWGKRLAFLVNGGWKAEAKSRTITVGDRKYLRLPDGQLRRIEK